MPASRLTIQRIETIPIRVPLRQVYRGSFYHMTHRATILARIHTAEGVVGERCWQFALPATFDILRDRRIGLVACAAVDTAIWDAVGKAVGQPLWRLWGGYRNQIGVIWTGGYYLTDLSIAEEMAAAREARVAGMKFKVGGRSPGEDAARFMEARRSSRVIASHRYL